MTGSVVLTLHGIQSENLPDQVRNDPAAQRYTIDKPLLENVLKITSHYNCQTLIDYLQQQQDAVTLTFDDGLITDYEVVLPKIQEYNLKATFFVTVDNVGKQGYCSREQLKEMINQGMEIGSHGWTHTYLITKSRAEVVKEIVDSKYWLEEELGVNITSYAPVGGHYENWMKTLAFENGYDIFATMIPGKNINGKIPYTVRRNHIQSHHSYDDIERLVLQSHVSSVINSLRYQGLRTLKQILGMQRYDRWKNVILRK